MLDTFLYFTIIVLLIIFFIKIKSNILGIFLLISYGFIALASIGLCLFPNSELNISNITFLPYLYLIIAYLIFFAPFLYSKKDLSSSKVIFKINKYYLIFAFLYITASLITIKISIPFASLMLQLGDWAASYREETPVIYSNFIEYVAILFTSYTRLLALILGVLMFRKYQLLKYKYIAFFLILSGIVTQIFSAIICTSRSMIFEIFLLLPAIYLFFYNDIDNKRKKIINTVILLSLLYVLHFFIDVTISRFESRGIFDSMLSYMGQAPIVFNTQMFGILDHFLYGDYTLGNLYGIKSFSPLSIGGLWGTRFYTFVGWLYVDWGEIGTIICGLLLNLCCYLFIKKKSFDISDVYILFSYYLFLIKGVFVIGRSYVIQIIAIVIIYFVLKIMDYFSRGQRA